MPSIRAASSRSSRLNDRRRRHLAEPDGLKEPSFRRRTPRDARQRFFKQAYTVFATPADARAARFCTAFQIHQERLAAEAAGFQR